MEASTCGLTEVSKMIRLLVLLLSMCLMVGLMSGPASAQTQDSFNLFKVSPPPPPAPVLSDNDDKLNKILDKLDAVTNRLDAVEKTTKKVTLPETGGYLGALREAYDNNLSGLMLCKNVSDDIVQSRSAEAKTLGYAFSVIPSADARFSNGTSKLKFVTSPAQWVAWNKPGLADWSYFDQLVTAKVEYEWVCDGNRCRRVPKTQAMAAPQPQPQMDYQYQYGAPVYQYPYQSFQQPYQSFPQSAPAFYGSSSSSGCASCGTR